VEPTLASLLSSDIRTEEDKKLAENYQKVTHPKLWEGRFLMPVTGEIITEFGSVRSYNGGPVVGHHAGADIAAGQGRNVVAPAKGKVVVIDKVQLRGNIVTLDHGLGVYTTYAHLSQIDVQVGQTVERGQAFAKVGSTGLSTGPHLHWELWVGGANVDPIEWTERDVP
jgi:murein DD-endopeptidase MepM/ murein hydrolase activator NlpD